MRTPIRELRQARGLSQGQLAKKVGTTQVTVSGWERGHHIPTGDNLRKLGEALGVEVSEIAYGGELRDLGRASVVETLRQELASGNPGIWRTEAGLFVRPDYAPVHRLFTGRRHHFEDYLAQEAKAKLVPVGTRRRGFREVLVYVFPGPDFPA